MLKNFRPILIVAGDPKSVFLEIYFKSLKRNKFKNPLILIVNEKILSEQMSYKERISFADDLIFNDGSLETFLAKLDFYYKLYDKLA